MHFYQWLAFCNTWLELRVTSKNIIILLTNFFTTVNYRQTDFLIYPVKCSIIDAHK